MAPKIRAPLTASYHNSLEKKKNPDQKKNSKPTPNLESILNLILEADMGVLEIATLRKSFYTQNPLAQAIREGLSPENLTHVDMLALRKKVEDAGQKDKLKFITHIRTLHVNGATIQRRRARQNAATKQTTIQKENDDTKTVERSSTSVKDAYSDREDSGVEDTYSNAERTCSDSETPPNESVSSSMDATSPLCKLTDEDAANLLLKMLTHEAPAPGLRSALVNG